MKEIIDEFFGQFVPPLPSATRKALEAGLQVEQKSKKEVLIREGQYNKKLYWLVKGATRSYYVQAGKEIHTWFAFEQDLVGTLDNFAGNASRETIQMLEDSVLIALHIPTLKSLAQEDLVAAQFVQEALLEHGLFLEDHLRKLQLKSAAQRVQALLEREPEVFRRVPLGYIASFLGISRETLSRLRTQANFVR